MMPELNKINHFSIFDNIPVELRRTKREKSITISISNGIVIVLAPKRVSDSEIYDLLAQKLFWIKEKLAKHRQTTMLMDRRFIAGEKFSFLGRQYPLQVVDGSKARAELKKNFFLIEVDSSLSPQRRARSVRAAFIQWYKIEANSLLRERANFYATQLGDFPKRITFSDYKSMWGKCTSNGDISFNWKLIMAPMPIIDYVVAHELAHLQQMNHSPDFWNIVKSVIPDYKVHRRWLKENGGKLQI